MTKTVCDVCGCDNPEYHCIVPMYKRYDMMKNGIKFGERKIITRMEADFYANHCTMLADFIERMKESAHVH